MKKITIGIVTVLALSLILAPMVLAKDSNYRFGFNSMMGNGFNHMMGTYNGAAMGSMMGDGYYNYGMGPGMMRGSMHGYGAGMHGYGSGMMGYNGIGGNGLSNQVAEVLNVDVEEIVQELQSGKSYIEIAKEKGWEAEKLYKEIFDIHKEYFKQFVDTRNMTDEQVEYMEDVMSQRLQWMLNFKN